MIRPGNHMPAAQVKLVTVEGVSDTTSDLVCAGPRTVMFTLPGAFTPTCSNNHLPGYQINAGRLREAGVAKIICATWNDHHVVRAWAESTGALPVIDFVADGNGELAKALGLERDMRDSGMGMRYRRAALIIENGSVTYAAAETESGVVTVSGAEAVLNLLQPVVA